MMPLHILEIFGTVIFGSIVGGIGTYVAASIKMGARLLVLERSVEDYHTTTNRRLGIIEEKAIFDTVCTGCKALWMSKHETLADQINSYHTEAQRAVASAQAAVESVKGSTKHDMEILNASNTTNAELLRAVLDAVKETKESVNKLKVVR